MISGVVECRCVTGSYLFQSNRYTLTASGTNLAAIKHLYKIKIKTTNSVGLRNTNINVKRVNGVANDFEVKLETKSETVQKPFSVGEQTSTVHLAVPPQCYLIARGANYRSCNTNK